MHHTAFTEVEMKTAGISCPGASKFLFMHLIIVANPIIRSYDHIRKTGREKGLSQSLPASDRRFQMESASSSRAAKAPRETKIKTKGRGHTEINEEGKYDGRDGVFESIVRGGGGDGGPLQCKLKGF